MMIGERLVASNVLNAAAVNFLEKQQSHLARYASRNIQLGQLAVEYGFATDEAINSALRQDSHDGHLLPVEIPLQLMRQFQFKPLGLSNTTLKISPLVALSDSEKTELINSCSRTGSIIDSIEEVSLESSEVLKYINELASDSQSLINIIDKFNINPKDGSAQTVLRGILNEAIQEKCSDIHVMRDNDILNCFVSYRIDGRLQVRHFLTPESSQVLTAKIKHDGGMDLANIREPQDGRLSFLTNRRTVDLRIASLPAGSGEKIVLRILDPADQRSLDVLLKDYPIVLKKLTQLTKFSGKNVASLMLVSGPTGAGKSSFLNGFIGKMDRLSISINTTEDPVEQRIRGITQTSVSSHAGLDFADVLRAQLRLDPDVLVIGEIRDRETAEVALKGAQSGHFVVSTVHASSCEESIQRLLNLLHFEYRSAHELTIANSLQTVFNLRLAPRYCQHCAEEVMASEVILNVRVLTRIGLKPGDITFKNKGCPRCRDTGFLGRILVPEALFIPSDFRVRRELMNVISGKNQQKSVTEIDGIEHFTRDDSVKTLVKLKRLDARTAAMVLGEFV